VEPRSIRGHGCELMSFCLPLHNAPEMCMFSGLNGRILTVKTRSIGYIHIVKARELLRNLARLGVGYAEEIHILFFVLCAYER
jgi:hypothetical protein